MVDIIVQHAIGLLLRTVKIAIEQNLYFYLIFVCCPFKNVTVFRTKNCFLNAFCRCLDTRASRQWSSITLSWYTGCEISYLKVYTSFQSTRLVGPNYRKCRHFYLVVFTVHRHGRLRKRVKMVSDETLVAAGQLKLGLLRIFWIWSISLNSPVIYDLCLSWMSFFLSRA